MDENSSYRLVKLLEKNYPGTLHVTDLRPIPKGDRAIFHYARLNKYLIVTFDSDFVQLSALMNDPPKVLLLTMKNPRKAEIASVLSVRKVQIENFCSNVEPGSPTVMEING